MKKNWGFIGCGNLSQALITGLLQKKILKRTQISASNRSPAKLKFFAKKHGIKTYSQNSELVRASHVIVLGAKPQDLLNILKEISPLITSDQVVISIAAGVDSETLQHYLPGATSVFRIMPNLAVGVQEGIFGIFQARGLVLEKKYLQEIFEKLGKVFLLASDEEVNVITAGSGSGAGFVVYFLEAFSDWFKQKGFSSLDSRALAQEIFRGSSVWASKSSNLTLSELKKAVTSKKGTTLAGLKAMQKQRVRTGVQAGLQAAYKRSIQISKALRQNSK